MSFLYQGGRGIEHLERLAWPIEFSHDGRDIRRRRDDEVVLRTTRQAGGPSYWFLCARRSGNAGLWPAALSVWQTRGVGGE
jgi:hypothetical protein